MSKSSKYVSFVVVGVLILAFVFTGNVLAKTRAVGVTSNYKWPVTVQSVRGKNYVTAPFPTKVGEPLSYCEVADGCRTWVNPPGTDTALGYSGNVTTYATINGVNTQLQVQIDTPSRLPTFQYTSPFKKFVGRYFDGAIGDWSNVGWVGSLKLGYSGLKIVYVPQKNRIYLSASNTLIAYNADTFFGAIQNEPLKYFYSQHPGSGLYSLGAIPWDTYFNPEEGSTVSTTHSPVTGWVADMLDHNVGTDWIRDFTVDDRGYIYIDKWNGFGVVKDNGSSIVPVAQILPEGNYPGVKDGFVQGSAGRNKIIHSEVPMGRDPLLFKANGRYYISVGRTDSYNREYSPGNVYGNYSVFDMTDPLKPEFVADGNSGKEQDKFVRIPSGQDDIIAIETSNADRSNSIEIYKASDFAMGGSPSKSFTSESFLIPGGGQRQCEGYNGLTADEVSGKLYSFSCVKEGTGWEPFNAKLSVFTPTNKNDPTTYTETKYDLGYKFAHEISMMSPKTYITARSGESMDFNNGYLTAPVQVSYPLPGRVNTNAGAFNGYAEATDIAFWVFKDGKPVELKDNNFTAKYYVTAPEGYARPDAGGFLYSQLMNYGGKDYFFYIGASQGDVYELVPSGASSSSTIATTTTNTNTPPATLYVPPATSGKCTAGVIFNKTNVEYGGSTTETWEIKGADLGKTYGNCGGGETQISAGPKSYTFTNLTKTTTCRVYGKIDGVEACTASATVTVGFAPLGQQSSNVIESVKMPDENNVSQIAGATVSTYDFGTTTLRQGSKGESVRELQRFLNDNLNLGLVLDGKLGPKTIAVIKVWQSENGLVADGLIGRKTKEKMNALAY